MAAGPDSKKINTVLFDFGGVLADEGFRNGLAAIGRISDLPEELVVRKGHDLVIETGYLTGRAGESCWWDALRSQAPIRGTDESLRMEILDRFTLRPWMLELVQRLKNHGFTAGILSDQTNWLDEIDARFCLYARFDFVFNSFHMGKSKHDGSHFDDVLKLVNRPGRNVLFIDDSTGHVGRAVERGFHAIRYENREDFLRRLAQQLQGTDGDWTS